MLGLPAQVTACLFDLDGVLTQTAVVHRAAWAETFDEFLRGFVGQRPFTDEDYNRFVDGRPRADGVRNFLASRAITLPESGVRALADRKNEILLRRLQADGVRVYDGSVAYLRAAGAAGLRRAVVSASANTRSVLATTGLRDLVEVVVDGVVAARDGLRGKPAPDTFLAAARDLGVPPAAAAVYEDAVAGVEAGRAGGFGFVVGVDRFGRPDEPRLSGHARDLTASGASIVVRDLAELLEAAP